MRIVIMSDSHGNSEAVMTIVERNIYTADMFIHLGDGELDTWRMLQNYPDVNLLQVRGNCDHADSFPDIRIIPTVQDIDNKLINIFATHGHLYNVNAGPDNLIKAAADNNCRIVLSGHTHRRAEINTDNILYINPGSCACPHDGRASYAYIDITMWGIITGFDYLE